MRVKGQDHSFLISAFYLGTVSIPRIGVVLSGATNDKEALLSAVRMAAREGARLRVVLAAGATREACEKHLDFALWDVQQRTRLRPPEIAIESLAPELELQFEQESALSTPSPVLHTRHSVGTQDSGLRTP